MTSGGVKKISSVLNQQKAIEDLSREVEKVLRFYQEHPEYPLDYDKIMKRVHEVTNRLADLREQTQRMFFNKNSHQ